MKWWENSVFAVAVDIDVKGLLIEISAGDFLNKLFCKLDSTFFAC